MLSCYFERSLLTRSSLLRPLQTQLWRPVKTLQMQAVLALQWLSKMHAACWGCAPSGIWPQVTAHTCPYPFSFAGGANKKGVSDCI